MLVDLHCISLRVVKHSDATSLVMAWSRERGCVTFSVPSGKSREAARRRALMMPFSLFEGVASVKPGKEISRISDVKPFGAGCASATDPVRCVVALFLSDFLASALRDSQPDALLSDFIFESVELLSLSQGKALANFHLYFVYHLGHFLGISPDTGTYGPGRFFDMREGVFTVTAPLHSDVLVPEEAHVLWTLSRLQPRTLGLMRLNREERNRALDLMLHYYSLHHGRLSTPASLSVLRDFFK